MKKTVEHTLLDRRSIRRYQREKISADDMEFIYSAIRNTPTSYNGQQYSVIDVADQDLKVKLYELTNQKQIKTCNHFLVFCADYHKISDAAKAKGIEIGNFPGTVDGYTVGVIDASLALMSAVVAAESRGLATCPIGYIRTVAPEKVAEMLGLPEGVALVCGLAIGVPSELPDLKPKEPESLIIHHDRYRSDSMIEDIMRYDADVAEYNRTRSGTTSDNDWAAHIISYYKEGEDTNLLSSMRRQGFLDQDS